MPTSQRPGAEAPEELLAEEINSPATEPQGAETSLTRRARGRSTAVPPRTKSSVSRPKKERAARTAPAGRKPKRASKPLRSLVILSMVGGLVATVALPAYGAWRPDADAVTLQQVAADDAQSLVVASDSGNTELAREGYSATTQAEIDQKKAEEAAAEAAAARARITSTVSAGLPVNMPLVSPGSR